MKKLAAFLSVFLFALGGLSTVQAQTYTNEVITIEGFHDDMTEESTTRNLDGSTQDFYVIDEVDTGTWDTLEQVRFLSHESLGEEYTDLYDGFDFLAEYYDLVFADKYESVEVKDMSGAQDEEYSAMVVTDEDGDEVVYMILDFQTEEIMINKNAIDSDPGHERTTVVMMDGLTAYESGYNNGYDDAETDKQPADAYLNDANDLIIESEDGTETDFGGFIYSEAYQDGYDDGEGSDFGLGWIMALFGAFTPIFAIELLPGLTIGLLIGIVMVPSVVLVFLKLFRG